MSDEKSKKPMDNNKQRYIIIAITLLIIFGIIMTSLPITPKKTQADVNPVSLTKETKTELPYEEQLEIRLVSILKKLEGAGRVEVMITTSASKEKVLAEETTHNTADTKEQDATGGTRTSQKEDTQNKIILGQGNVPIVIKETRPQVEGVLVLAEGADDTNIKNAIIQSVSSLLSVPVHKISVFKMGKN